MADETTAADPRLLEALRAEIHEKGVRRATVTSVAQRAGLSRVTFYRNASGIEELIKEATGVEMAAAISAAAQAGVRRGPDDRRSDRERVVDTFVTANRTMARSEFLQAIIRHDPDYLAPFVFHRMGTIQHTSRAAMSQVLMDAADGSIRADLEVDHAALVLTLCMRPFILGRSFLLKEIGDEALEQELRALVDGYLRPVE